MGNKRKNKNTKRSRAKKAVNNFENSGNICAVKSDNEHVNMKSADKKTVSKKTGSEKLLSKTDWYAMAVLTLVFMVLVFFRLGRNEAPNTSETFTYDGNHEIVLDLGDYMSVTDLDIFLGNLDNRKIAISTFNEVTGEWELINGEANITSVFAWNTIPINYSLRYLGIVFLDDEAVVNEIVLKSPDGILLQPINMSEYHSLFDEQRLYPKYKSYMDQTMFDEIYHGRTAYEFIHGLTTYETTHPHMGKILISLGICLFGMNPFGWRVMCAFLGSLMVPIMYLFAKRITKETFFAIITTLLLVVDFMHYGLSRISTIDVPVALFILLMYYFMYAYLSEETVNLRRAYVMLMCSGIAMGFGMSIKFTGIYAGAGLGVIFIIYTLKNFPKNNWKQLLKLCLVFFVLVPILIYSIGFIPVVEYYESSNFAQKVINGTKSMISYHANLEATHYYSSKWYTWPIVGKPLLLVHDFMDNGKVSTISIMGNPFVTWTSIPCILFMIYHAVVNGDKKAKFLVIAYLAQYIPWILVSRIVFIYHYFPSSLFGILIIGYTMKIVTEKWPKTKKWIYVYATVAVMFFVAFFPVISGLPFDVDYIKSLKWLPNWVFTY